MLSKNKYNATDTDRVHKFYHVYIHAQIYKYVHTH